MSTNTIPSFFAVSRAIQYSDGYLTAVLPNGQTQPIEVKEFSVRGSKSSHGDGYKLSSNDIKETKDFNTPNPQTVDGAFLPAESNRLRLSFSMNVLPVTTENQSCNDFSYTAKVKSFIDQFNYIDGFFDISLLLVWRIANASVLWRNQYGIEKTVTVKCGESCWSFQSDSISNISPEGFAPPMDLVKIIMNALSGESNVLMLDVSAEVTLGYGQEVFPSQEMEMNKAKNTKSKLLYTSAYRNTLTAAMHPQKIGAAIRAFDIWHPSYEKTGPLSIEPLGYSHKHQKSFRTPSTQTDLYAYLKELDQLTEKMKEVGVTNEALYIIGCFMRGGVFSASADAAEKAAAKQQKMKEKADREEDKQAEKLLKAQQKQAGKKSGDTDASPQFELSNV